MQKYIEALRTMRYVKNLLVLLPLVVASDFLNYGLVGRALLGFVFFCFTASAAYVMNDLFDREKDQSFRLKSDRAISKKEIKGTAAVIFAILLAVIGVAGALALDAEFGLILLGFLVLSLWYSAWFQHIAVLDLTVLSALTAVRVAAGALVIGITPSPYMMLVAFFLGLTLALVKKIQEKNLILGTPEEPLLISSYSSKFLEAALVSSSSLTLMSYVLFALLDPQVSAVDDNSLIYIGILFFFVTFRIAYLVLAEKQKKLAKDLPLTIGSLIFVAAFVLVFYLVA